MSSATLELFSPYLRSKLHKVHRAFLAPERQARRDLWAAIDKALPTQKKEALKALKKATTPEQFDAIIRFAERLFACRYQEAMQLERPACLRRLKVRGEPITAEEQAIRRAFLQWGGCEGLEDYKRTHRVNTLTVLRGLHLGKWEELKLDWYLLAPCRACGEEGQVYLLINRVRVPTQFADEQPSLEGFFICPYCEHKHEIQTNELRRYNEPITEICSCAQCKKKRLQLLRVLTRIFHQAQQETLEKACLWLRDVRVKQGPVPTEQAMRRDYELRKNNLNKDLRAILSIKPKNIDGMDGYYLSAKAYYEAYPHLAPDFQSFFNTLGFEAVKNRVLYCLDDYDKLSSESFSAFVGNCDSTYSTIKPQTQIDAPRIGLSETSQRKLATATAFFESDELSPEAKADRLRASPDMLYFLQASRMHPVVGRCIEPSTLAYCTLTPKYGQTFILNPFFANPPITTYEPVPMGKPLFASPTEDKAFRRLLSEYPGCIIVPNRPLRQIVDIQTLQPYFPHKEGKYLWSCILDLCVYNEHGRFLFAEEVQRGRHHNAAEWIEKDAIKRRACQIAGIPLVESF